MIGRLTHVLRATASSEIYAVHAKAALERGLCKTLDVSSIGRAFESMQKNDLPPRSSLRLMLDHTNDRRVINLIFLARRRKSPLVNLPRPEVACYGQKVGIVDKRLKVGQT